MASANYNSPNHRIGLDGGTPTQDLLATENGGLSSFTPRCPIQQVATPSPITIRATRGASALASRLLRRRRCRSTSTFYTGLVAEQTKTLAELTHGFRADRSWSHVLRSKVLATGTEPFLHFLQEQPTASHVHPIDALTIRHKINRGKGSRSYGQSRMQVEALRSAKRGYEVRAERDGELRRDVPIGTADRCRRDTDAVLAIQCTRERCTLCYKLRRSWCRTAKDRRDR